MTPFSAKFSLGFFIKILIKIKKNKLKKIKVIIFTFFIFWGATN
jgi:hypothetical protein